MEKAEIDIVIMWVDDSDDKWNEDRNYYHQLEKKVSDSGNNRYRDWGTLKYLFRGIEKFAPWIRKVFFVTCGQKPDWLDPDNPKLVFVNHSEYIPKEYLPTFSSPTIDLNLWRIHDLSEFFILFNDDMFLTDYVSQKDFVKNNKCCNMFVEQPVFPGNLDFNYTMMYCMKIMMKYYSRKEVLRNNRKNILCLRYGIFFFYNLIWSLFPFKKFSGLSLMHFPMAQRKSQWEEVYCRDKKIFDETCSHKFRQTNDVSRFIFHYDQLLSGDFYPQNMIKKSKFYNVEDVSICDELCKDIATGKYKTICINDECNDNEFEEIRRNVLASFEILLPEKCSFEI